MKSDIKLESRRHFDSWYDRPGTTDSKVPLHADEEFYDGIATRVSRGKRAHDRGTFVRTRFLERVLMSEVGRPWNKVYSEICAQFSAKTTKGRRIRDEVTGCYGTVDTNCFIDENGEIRTYSSYSPFSTGPRQALHPHPKANGLYVHPKTGILSYRKLTKEQARNWPPYKKDITNISLGEGLSYSYLECNTAKGPKDRFWAWFKVVSRLVKSDQYRFLTPKERDCYESEMVNQNSRYFSWKFEAIMAYHEFKLVLDKDLERWAKMTQREEWLTEKYYCNNEELAIIEAYIKEHEYGPR